MLVTASRAPPQPPTSPSLAPASAEAPTNPVLALTVWDCRHSNSSSYGNHSTCQDVFTYHFQEANLTRGKLSKETREQRPAVESR